MVEIQCSSCHTRYRIDERVLPDETPTFKCSRCGHVFSIEPRGVKSPAKPGQARGPASKAGSDAKPAAESKPAATKLAPAPEAVEAAKPPQSRVRRPLRVVPPSPPREPESPPESPSAPQAASGDSKTSDAGATKPSDTNPLARPFADSREEPEAADGTSFDFSSETEEHPSPPAADTSTEEDHWEAGEFGMEFQGEPSDRPAKKPRPAKPPREAPAGKPREEREFARPEMPSLGTSVHSSGFFIAWFFFVALGFGALSLLIAGAPSASAALLTKLPMLRDRFTNPLSPATSVALRNVHAEYQAINGGSNALVITGEAANVTGHPLHAVRIAASLLDGAQQQIAGQTVFCGNSLSGRIIGQMTGRELDFFQKLGPPKTFVLPPSGSSAFVIVFTEPPRAAAKLALKVVQAQQAAMAAPEATATPGA